MRRFLLIGLILGLMTGQSQSAQAQQAQSRPKFCQINSSNIGEYVSQYNMFTKSAPTAFRPFLINKYPYKINQELVAMPLFYLAASDGTIAVAFELKGKYGNFLIDKKDTVIQHLNFNPAGSYAELTGVCVNGEFMAPKKKEVLDFYKLPLDTQSALREASFSVQSEQSGSVFK